MQRRHTFAGLRGTSSLSHTEHFLSPSANTCCLVPTLASPSIKTLGCTFCSFCKPCSWLSLLRLQSSLSLSWHVNLLLIFIHFPAMPPSCFFMSRSRYSISFISFYAVLQIREPKGSQFRLSSWLPHSILMLFWLHLPQLYVSCTFIPCIWVSVWPRLPLFFSCSLA